MAEITIFTTQYCPYCISAKHLLLAKGVEFEEIDVGQDPEKRADMTKRAGGRYTVPQIFVGSTHVGGSDDLHALERAGKLDAMLAAA
jgi:glutaredoxin 3